MGGGLRLSKFLISPLFAAGVLLRLAAIYLGDATPLVQWYVPFLENSLADFSPDPWSSWLAQENASLSAFPYGYAMWLPFLPFSAICSWLGVDLGVGYLTTLFCVDLCMLAVLHAILQIRLRTLLITYWLSPIIVVGTYYLGLNDLIPALLLVISILMIQRKHFFKAGCFLVAAFSAKLSMLMALPFIIIYIFHNKALHRYLVVFAKGFLVGMIVLCLPLALSPGNFTMILNNPEMSKLYQLRMSFGTAGGIYIVPFFYLLVLYAAWRIRRPNFDLFVTILSVAFLGFVLLTAGSPGWFIWATPFLVYYQAESGKMAVAITLLFSLAYAVAYLFQPLLDKLPGAFTRQGLDPAFMLQTIVFALGIILLIRICRESIYRSYYFRLSRKPFVVGVTGDSGAGKDTYVNALEDFFGAHSVARLSGDDYHRWDRNKPMWKVMTHLNPLANYLERFTGDLLSLVYGKAVYSSRYDHGMGKMSKPHKVISNDFILASGLHVLHLPMLRRCYDLGVYLDMDEGLRRFFKFRRDVADRGHSPEKVLADIARRMPDSEKFIHPQRQFADLLLAVQPIEELEGNFDKMRKVPRLRLHVASRLDFNAQSLVRVLSGVFGLHVDVLPSSSYAVAMNIDGDMGEEDIAMAVRMLCPETADFMDASPRWRGGILGLMQLVTLMHINQSLKRRLI
jgi:uridine kinase